MCQFCYSDFRFHHAVNYSSMALSLTVYVLTVNPLTRYSARNQQTACCYVTSRYVTVTTEACRLDPIRYSIPSVFWHPLPIRPIKMLFPHHELSFHNLLPSWQFLIQNFVCISSSVHTTCPALLLISNPNNFWGKVRTVKPLSCLYTFLKLC